MRFDFIRRVFGKAREQAAQTAFAHAVKTDVNWQVIGTRVATVAAGALLKATVEGHLPPTIGGALTLSAGAVVAAGPSIFQAAGVFKAVSPGTITLADALGAKVSAVLGAPKAARQSALEAAVAQEVRAYGPMLVDLAAEKVLIKTGATGKFTPDKLYTPEQVAGAEALVGSLTASSVLPAENAKETSADGTQN